MGRMKIRKTSILDNKENRTYFEMYQEVLNSENVETRGIEGRRISMLMRIGGLLETIDAMESTFLDVDWEVSAMVEYYKLLYRYKQYEDSHREPCSEPRKATRVVKLQFYSDTLDIENEKLDYAILDGMYVATPVYRLPEEKVLAMLRKYRMVKHPEEFGLPSEEEVNYGSLQWDGNDEYDRLIGRKYGAYSDFFLYHGTCEFPVALVKDSYVGECVSHSRAYRYASPVYYS